MEQEFIDILIDYCKNANKIFFYASCENGTRYVNFAFKIQGKNLKKNEADLQQGFSIDDSISKQKEYLDKLQKKFEKYIIDYKTSNKKELSELKLIFDNTTKKLDKEISVNNNFSGESTFTTAIFDKWYKSQK